MSKTVVKTTPFLLIAAPDATMTLRTLQSYLEPLLNLHPHGQVLLLGLPGLPNTHWPRSLRLTAPVQARAAARLLHYLLRSGKINPKREVPVFWVGFGNGTIRATNYTRHNPNFSKAIHTRLRLQVASARLRVHVIPTFVKSLLRF